MHINCVGYWREGNNCMKKDIRYSKAPESVDDALISAQIIEDFLPPTEKLIPKEITRAITFTLLQKSAEFFKEKSKESQVPISADDQERSR